MTRAKVSDFVFNGKGAITLQFATLACLLTMSWKISEWKADIEYKIEKGTSNRFSSTDMTQWSSELAVKNKDLDVPSVWSAINHSRGIK